MGAVFPVMKKYFRQQGWQTERIDKRPALRMQYQGKSGEFTCYAIERGETGQFIFYVMYPRPVPSDKRKAMTEFITRANYGLVVGNFEMDLIDGELRYKASLDLEGETPTLGLIHRVVSACVGTMDRYYPGIEKVISDRLSPADVIADIEKS